MSWTTRSVFVEFFRGKIMCDKEIKNEELGACSYCECYKIFSRHERNNEGVMIRCSSQIGPILARVDIKSPLECVHNNKSTVL